MGDNMLATRSQPLTCLRRAYTFLPQRGPFTIIHLLCAPPSKCQSHLSVCETGLARPLAEGGALREDASSLVTVKIFPTSSDVVVARGLPKWQQWPSLPPSGPLILRNQANPRCHLTTGSSIVTGSLATSGLSFKPKILF